MDTLIPLSSLTPLLRCPACSSHLASETREQPECSTNGVQLFTISQMCARCGWRISSMNVKMGA